MFSTKDIIKTFNNPINLLIFLSISFLLGIGIAFTYKKNNHNVSYSQSFVNTIALLLPVVTLIIMFISNDLARAIGVFGAFSVVRFRTAVKDAKDMFFIFWVLATGLIIGTGDITSALVTTPIIAGMVYLLTKTNFGRFSNYDYLVIYVLDTSKSDISQVTNKLKEFTKTQDILNVQTAKDGKEIEITTSVIMRKNENVDVLLTELKKIKAIKSLSINPAKFDLEY